jgi:hypothetical protein
MKRPDFSDQEKRMISQIVNSKEDIFSILLYYLPWIFIPTGLFFYGFFKNESGLIITGFLLIFFQLIRFVYFQFKPDYQIRSIIEKYESCFNQDEKND